MTKITPVILAGGKGKRLWPTSREDYPKQFSKLIGDKTLFQQCALRTKFSENVNFSNHCVVTNEKFRFLVGQQLLEVGLEPGHIILEPMSKNTGPAILAAAIYARNQNEDTIMLVCPSDHLIPDTVAFHCSIEKGLKEVKSGNIVTFGILPDRPETGYGYLEVQSVAKNKPMKLKSFIEKPTIDNAKTMLKSGKYLWNSGIFLFHIKDIIKAAETVSPELFYNTEKSIEKGCSDLGFFRLNENSWSKCDDISIDYSIMEKTRNLVTIPFFSEWSDLGDWNSIWKELKPSNEGVVTSGNSLAINCKNVLLRSENDSQVMVGLSLKDIVAIGLPDTVLVANKNETQKINMVVDKLKEKGISQAEFFPKDHRPWGWFETIISEKSFKVKKIQVDPNHALSLQSHKYRSENWVVVKGEAKVTVDKEEKLILEGESVLFL